jgi:hypothetical protein
VFVIPLRGQPGTDSVHSLRAIVKSLLRRHRLRCVSIGEEGAT